MASVHIVFDVVGTCVSYSAFYTRIASVHITAQTFGFTWQTSAELEFTFLSISSSHVPYTSVLRALFYRTLYQCGVPNPHSLVSDEQREECIAGYAALEVREGVKEAFNLLRNEGFAVWCFTTGDVGRVKGYFDRADIDMPVENVISCDGTGVVKPALAAYQGVWDRFGQEDVKWFAAAHMWDVAAATKVGFRGAWSDVLEGEAAVDIFGEGVEVLAKGVVDMARRVVEKSA
ncbi:HAD-like domain-containing protein [Phaeosphaeria sp. MPI-PUGE-AT-0046c]|nr:HAD-like domain-containing protein [Phaeosphaeria sp. MPI-PUGE-AT-0046c]